MTDDSEVTSAEKPRFSGIERRREGRVRAFRPYGALALIILGLLIFGGEVFEYFFHHIPMSGGISMLGACLGFIGFYMFNHQDTKDGAQFIVTSGIAIVGAIRGRRATDPPGTTVPVVSVKEDKPD